MADVNHRVMTLSPDQLNSLDEWILDFLSEHEWASPHVLRVFYNEEQGEDESVSRQWISQRITRLDEHGHVRHIHPDTSTYRLVSDPRNSNKPGDGTGTTETDS